MTETETSATSTPEPSEPAQSFGERLRALREQMGLKQADIAKMANIATESYARLERDNSTPTVETLKVLAQVFSTSIDVLVGRERASESLEVVNADMRRLIKAARKLGSRELNLTAQLAEELGRSRTKTEEGP